MQRSYCPKVGREVHIGTSETPDEPVCYDYDPDRCAGPCPVVKGTHSLEMGRRFAATPEASRRLIRTRLWCRRCSDTVTMRVVGGSHLFCTSCGDFSARFH